MIASKTIVALVIDPHLGPALIAHGVEIFRYMIKEKLEQFSEGCFRRGIAPTEVLSIGTPFPGIDLEIQEAFPQLLPECVADVIKNVFGHCLPHVVARVRNLRNTFADKVHEAVKPAF